MTRNHLLLIVLTAYFSGCATFGTSIRPISLRTTPDEATATADAGRLDCITPCSLKLESDSDHTITFHKDGFQDASVELVSVGSGWLFRGATLRPVAVLEFNHPEAYSLSRYFIQVMLPSLPASRDAEAPQLAVIQNEPTRQTEANGQQYFNQQVRQYVNHQNSASRLKAQKFPLLGLLSNIGIGSGSGFGMGLSPGPSSSYPGAWGSVSPPLEERAICSAETC